MIVLLLSYLGLQYGGGRVGGGAGGPGIQWVNESGLPLGPWALAVLITGAVVVAALYLAWRLTGSHDPADGWADEPKRPPRRGPRRYRGGRRP